MSKPPSRRTPDTDAVRTRQAQLAQAVQGGELPLPFLSTNQGVRIADNHNALRAGARGPTLLEDFVLREKLTHFDHERIPERVVHARGSAAHGHFQVYKSMSQLTCADFLQEPGLKTPVFVRFSTVAGGGASADTVRDVRGFAVKFFTRAGNYDLVGNNMPVFFIQDAIKFPDLVHALKPEPQHGMPQATSAHDTFWDFVSLMPETTHMLMWLMSDRALPRSLRMMQGFGVHTFRWVNAHGEAHFVKYHWTPRLGSHALLWDEAQKIAGVDPDFHRRDLWQAIAQGDLPEWELGVQLIPEARADSLGIDLLDPTKLLPAELVPITPVGKLVLERNPDNFFAETEQVAFHPGHLVPGIDFTNDPLLQGRLFSYSDTQLSRLGGPNFHELPINRGLCPVHNFQRDGMHRQAVAQGAVAYEPNSLGNGNDFRVDGGKEGFTSWPETVDGSKLRARSASFDEHFAQARLFLASQSAVEREHIVAAFRFELGQVTVPAIRQRMVDNLAHADERLARRVADGLGLGAPDARAAAGRAGFRPGQGGLALEEARSLRMIGTGDGSVRSRRVAILVAHGVDSASLKPLRDALAAAGLRCTVVGAQLGAVRSASQRKLEVDATFAAMPSVMFDAVLVPAGAQGAEQLCAWGEAVHFVHEAYKHGKALCAVGEGRRLLAGLGIGVEPASAGDVPDATALPPGVLLAPTPAVRAGDTEAVQAIVRDFVHAIAQHRHWGRADLERVAA